MLWLARVFLRKLLRDQRGTSTFEATLVLPVMAICWAGAWFQFKMIDSSMIAVERARHAAWMMTTENCDSVAHYDSATGGANDPPLQWLEQICKVPVLGEIVGSLFGYSFTAEGKSDPYARIALLGGGERQARVPYFIMCNEKHMGLDEVLRNVMCKEMKKLNLNFDFAVDCPEDRHPEVRDACGP
jgi:hypothetical protein